MKISAKYDKKILMAKGEVKVFPITLCAETNAKVKITFSSHLSTECISTAGKDYLGNDFSCFIEVGANKPRNFWCVIKIDDKIKSGTEEVKFFVCDKDGNELYQGEIEIVITEETVG